MDEEREPAAEPAAPPENLVFSGGATLRLNLTASTGDAADGD